VLIAKAARVRCIFVNVGAGPLTHFLSKRFAKSALRAADYVSFRDHESRALAREIGFAGKSEVFPDTVYSLEVPSLDRRSAKRSDQPIVGIAPMPYCDPRLMPGTTKQMVYGNFISKLAIFASGLARDCYGIALFGSDIGVDPLAIEDLRLALQDHNGISALQIPTVGSVQQLLQTMAGMDYIVTCRFHGVVFAHLLNKPVLAISHHPKVATLMKDLGLSDYCVDIEQFNPNHLIDVFASLVKNTNMIKSCMAVNLASYKAQLTSQFDSLFCHGERENVEGRLVGAMHARSSE